MKRVLIVTAKIVLPLVLLAAAILYARYLIETRASSPRTPPPTMVVMVDVEPLARGHYTARVRAGGSVIPARQVTLQPEVTGRVVSFNPSLTPGGMLQEGEMVLNIDPRDYEFALERAREQLARAEFELKREQGQQAVAEREWRLFEGHAESSDPGRALALREPHLEYANAVVAAAHSQVEQAELNLARTTITAPFNAVVLEEAVEIGQLVTPQTRLASLAGTDRYWVRVSVPMSRLGWIGVPGLAGAGEGSRAVVRQVMGEGEEIAHEGRVVRLLGDLDEIGRMARLLVEVEDPLDLRQAGKPPLLLGAYVQVTIEGVELPDVFALSRTSVHDGDEVWIMNGEDRLDIREIEVVWGERETVYVRGEIHEGERLIVSNIAMPVQGMQLREMEDELSLPQREDAESPPAAGDEATRS